MLSWIPIFGPIIDGIVSIFKGFTDVSIAKTKAEAQIQITEDQESTKVIQATKDDIPLRIARDIVIFPWAAWGGLIGWDTIMVYPYPALKWGVAAPPASVAYLPGMVLVYLLGSVGLNIWKGK